MFISKKELSHFLETEAITTNQLVEALTNLAYEVESVTTLDNISGVKFGKIISCEKHPNADSLSLLSVNTDGEIYTVVCGGANVARGQIVAHAIPGSRVGNIIMSPKTLRGIESFGMILSISEIGGIDPKLIEIEEADNIYVFPSNQDMSLDPADVVGLKDEIIEISILPDRQYVSSYRELGRELSAYLGINFGNVTIPFIPEELDSHEYNKPKIVLGKNAVSVDTLYAHLTGKGRTKQFIKNTLYAAKIQPTDTLADILIYVRLLKGTVGYALDYSENIKLDGIHLNQINIFTDELLNNKTDKVVLVAIASSEQANIVNISNLNYPMGILNTKGTKFAPTSLTTIAKYAQECGYIDKVSSREFKKSLPTAEKSKVIHMDKKFIAQYVGEKIPLHDVLIKMERVGIAMKNDDWFIPYRRIDLETKQDLVEEVVRFYGINKIKTAAPKIGHKIHVPNPKKVTFQNISQLLVNCGINEAKTYQLITEKQAIQYNIWNIKNYSQLRDDYSVEYNTLQTSLMYGLIETYKYNYRQGYSKIAFFELANIFIDENPNYSAGIILDDEEFENPTLILKEMILQIIEMVKPNIKKIKVVKLDHPLFNHFNSIAIEIDKEPIAILGELHPSLLREHKFIRIDKVKRRLYYAEINLEKIILK